MTEGRKMFITVITIFLAYAVIFLVFEDYDRNVLKPLSETSDWYLLLFSLLVMTSIGIILYRYSQRMDKRISREQAAEQSLMRRELTQNIAHELKTPVTSIQGYIETILDNPDIPEKTKVLFLERSLGQAKRLTALLQDISTLNRMDYAADQYEFEPIDIVAIVSQIEQETALSLEKQQMKFLYHMPVKVMVNGNHSLVYSIFRNLMDNAVNYAGSMTTVTLTATELKSYWQFTFSDNGAGLPPRHLPRLFERFYRVDTGRSRSMGGTGLGLSIVKNAVMLHDGTITAQLNSDGGLTFLFSLKK